MSTFFRTAAAVPRLAVAAPDLNITGITELYRKAASVVELGYLFSQGGHNIFAKQSNTYGNANSAHNQEPNRDLCVGVGALDFAYHHDNRRDRSDGVGNVV